VIVLSSVNWIRARRAMTFDTSSTAQSETVTVKSGVLSRLSARGVNGSARNRGMMTLASR
jgi:hypothetical protein